MSQQSLTQLLDQIEARANAATPGPWRFAKHWGPYNWQGAILHDGKGVYNLEVLQMATCTPERDANGSFIAAARSDVPKLVEALREAIDSFEAIAEPENKEPWSRDVAIEALSDIAKLLSEQTGTAADSVLEPNATSTPPSNPKTFLEGAKK